MDVYILCLRQKIEKDPAAPLLIQSVRRFGYSFEPRGAENHREEQREEITLDAAS